jgi:hypothetical protein
MKTISFGMPTLIELDTLEEQVVLCKELGLENKTRVVIEVKTSDALKKSVMKLKKLHANYFG